MHPVIGHVVQNDRVTHAVTPAIHVIILPFFLLVLLIHTICHFLIASCHRTTEVLLLRFSRLIILLIITALTVLAIHLQDNPAHAANPARDSGEQMAIQAQGRDILVIDGDTIMIDGTVADIAGIDAPELGQQCLHNGSFRDCGLSSAIQIRKYFAMAPFAVHCWPGDQQRSGKSDNFPILECVIGERDVAAAMIMDGEALPVAGYSHHYDSLSQEAANATIGLHGKEMIPPTEWRNGKRLDGENGRCLFLADGKGHYLGKLDPRYDALESGDGLTALHFCSDEEARAAGLSYAPLEK